MSKTKIGADGKPYDPAAKARREFAYIRQFVERSSLEGMTYGDQTALLSALNGVADRLATCDALEGRKGQE
jgi:hypothetical protein